MQAVNSVVESQILAKLTYYKYRNFAKLQHQAGFSLPSSLQQSIGVWRKRQALSTSSTSQLTLDLAGLYPYNPIILIQHPCRIRLQQRCNLDSSRGGAYTFFPLNLQFGEASGDAPV
jgi:hypothetical protein